MLSLSLRRKAGLCAAVCKLVQDEYFFLTELPYEPRGPSIRDDSPERILQHCTSAQAADLGDGQAPEGAVSLREALGLSLSARPYAQREGLP